MVSAFSIPVLYVSLVGHVVVVVGIMRSIASALIYSSNLGS